MEMEVMEVKEQQVQMQKQKEIIMQKMKQYREEMEEEINGFYCFIEEEIVIMEKVEEVVDIHQKLVVAVKDQIFGLIK